MLICMVGKCSVVWEKLSHYVPHWLYHYTFPSTMNESSGCSISLPAFDVICAPYLGHSIRYIVISFTVALICVSLMTYDIEYLSTGV